MDYKYFLEDIGNKNLDQNDIDSNVLYILCYHIENECKYPFLQFMMEKIPFCDNLIKEQFVLPHINNNNGKNIKHMALEKVKGRLNSINCDTNSMNDDMYKGMIWINNWYILINISEININSLYLSRNNICWFILPSEIINIKEVCGIDIDNEVTSLFTANPRLGILTNPRTKNVYILPDAVYTAGEYKSVEFMSIFGNRKKKIYENCGEYFYFYRDLNGIIKDAEFKDGINRYALFIEGELYIEIENSFSLTDSEIEKMYPEPCIIICYTNIQEKKPDILVKDYDSFISLSYHKLDKEMNKTNKKYMICY